ncbi:outer membrane beta-barrel protein [Flavobacterium sp. SUN046]|uniref:TonB-dependent receptor n=1 Tax=Flavobacterium sp. SUN046 TaxID=3002440 RepID=UPI002DBA6874|nr:outer membrane beta-barrel protein [Flavobacterium sp. SUN046]MEC4047979.1 outer membrane beta-barrel protein [Flavobacterium sp. SUN046]
MLRFRVFILILFLILVSKSFAQNSGIKGIIVDENNGQPIAGATLTVKGTNKSQVTDSDGNFTIQIKEGVYVLKISSFSYEPKEVTDIIVKKDDVNFISISISSKKNQLEEVVIKSTKAKQESVKALLSIQKNSANVSDGISAETIKRTPDKNTSDVLKRISGASIQDNRFVIIRGLNDRYNYASLNGSPLPSSEPDRKAFSFDIFPSNMIDNIMITKTASPDLPGEFAGGVVQINTKSVPDKNFQSITVGSGYNSITTFKNNRTYVGSSTDWLGFDNGARAMPSNLPTTEVFNTLNYQDKALLAKSFQTDWSINDAKFKPNTSFQYSIGRHFDIKNKVFGMLFSITHNVTNNFNQITRNEFDSGDSNLPSTLTSTYLDKNYSQQVLSGLLGNFSFKFNENHSINFKNVFSVNSTDLVVERNGQRDLTSTGVVSADVRWFTSNKIYSGQLNGEHYFPKPKIKILWNGFFSDIKRSIPNLRRNIYYTIDPNSADPIENTPIASIASNNGGPDYGGGMFFSENNETVNGGKVDFIKKIIFTDDFLTDIKVGGLSQIRSRNFFSRQLQYNMMTIGGNFDYNLLYQTNATIFSASNMGQIAPASGGNPAVNGFTLYDFTKYTDSYDAGSKLNAAYVMLDNRYKKFRFVWGLRLEDYLQTLNSRLSDNDYLNLNRRQQDILPSANLIFSATKTQNIRISYSKTLNRPEFRELAPFGFYDFTNQFFTQGNPDLKICKIQNIDFRYEIYPGKGQLFSVSYFKKYFQDPIELKQELNNKTVTYRNANSAVNSGVEFEFRTLLSSIFNAENAPLLDDITLFSNIAIIKSKVDLSNFTSSTNNEKERPLQGQSPYVFNGGIQYMNKDNGWVVAANVNRVGNRIAFGGSEVEPSIWEKSRTFLDMQISKSFYNNKLELRFNAQNILAQDLIFYQNKTNNSVNHDAAFVSLTNTVFTGSSHNDNGYNKNLDDTIWVTKFGRTFSLSISYNF